MDNSNDTVLPMLRFPTEEYISRVSRTLPKCLVCKEAFNFPGSKNTNYGYHKHLPVLLSCGHSICETCLWRAKPRKFIKCPKCNTIHNLQFKKKTFEQFEYSFHICGLVKNILYFPNDKSVPSKQAVVPNCGECSQPVADRKCVQCDSLYCYDCFKKVHSLSKVLRTHQIVDLATTLKFTHSPAICEIHQKQVNFYCEICEKSICVDCKSQVHLLHSVIQLYDKNVNTQKEIPSYVQYLDQLMQLVNISLETCTSTLTTEQKFAQETINKICNHFIEVHGKLQVLEFGLINKVKNRFMEDVGLVQKIQDDLKLNKDRIEVNLEKLNYYARNTPYDVDLESLLKDVGAFAKELPCDLSVSQPSDNPFTFEKPREPIRLSANHDVKIGETISLRMNPYRNLHTPPRIRHASTSQSQDEVQRSRSPRDRRDHSRESSRHSREGSRHSRERSRERKHKKDRKKKKSRSDVEISSRDSSRTHVTASVDLTMDQDEPRKKKNKKSSRKKSPKERKSKALYSLPLFSRIVLRPKIESESVRVSHIGNPQEMYIQNLTFVSSMDHFFKMCADVAQQQVKVEELHPKEIYLVPRHTEKSEQWYRGVLKTFHQQENLYEMTLIDFGSTIKVPKGKVRSCSAVLKKTPPNAIQCSLYNLTPRRGKWSDEVNVMLAELLTSDTVTKMTLGVEGDVHIVDLIVMKNLSPVSIRDMLVKLHLAREVPSTDHLLTRLIDDLRKQINAAQTATPKFFSQTVDVGAYFPPKVVHVISPMEFYVMKALDCSVYEEQRAEMDRFYNDDIPQKIYSPDMGMAVAIHYQQHWHRAEVTGLMGDLQIQVKLVDLGIELQTSIRSLRALNSRFMCLTKGAIACSLAHVAPLETNNYTWPHEALETFKALTNSSNLELFVHSAHSSKPNFYNVTLYSVRKDKNISINAQLVQLEFAGSTGAESVQVEFHKEPEDEETEEETLNASYMAAGGGKFVAPKKSHRKAANILSTNNPGEFYVILTQNLAGIDKVQRTIQKHMMNYVPPAELPDWQVDDMVYAKTQTPDDVVCEWRRAVVRRKDEDEYEVFLIDYGVQVSVKKDAVAPIVGKDLDKRTCCGAIRCHMSNIEPTGGNKMWTSSSVDKFRSYCSSRKFEGYAVTMMGPWVNGSVPVILWGRIEEDDPLQPTIVRWKNINESLVKRGYAALTEKFPVTFENEAMEQEMLRRDEEFEQFIERLSEYAQSEAMMNSEENSLVNQVTADVTPVMEWKSADPWTEKIFTGIATCVDNNGLICMYNIKYKEVLDKMREVANNTLMNTMPSVVEKFWSKNQPCMAKYHLDKLFYRATVRRVNKEKNTCLVHFVDYGNIEECSFDDMRKMLLFGNIPILSHRFKMSNILPVDTTRPWPCVILDKIHGYTVGNECSATLADDPADNRLTPKVYDIVSLRMGAIELVSYLVQNEMAVYTKNTQDSLVERSQLECVAPTDCLVESTSEPKETTVELPSTDELDCLSKYREFFQKKDIDELMNSPEKDEDEESDYNSDFKEESDSDEDVSQDSDDDDEVVESAAKKIRSEESSDEFTPAYSSTKVPDSLQIFPTLQLEDDCEGFYGQATELTSALELYFYPEIESHQEQHNKMDSNLQAAAAFYPTVTTVNPAIGYLVRYDEDNRWYRAIVNADQSVEEEFLASFVDYLNTEMVTLKHIKPLNLNIQSIPLRNIRLRLADVKLNPRYRPDDIERELRTMLHQKRVYVKIVKRAETPQQPHLVKIYANKDDKEVIYEPLVLNKYFIRQGKNF